jgi:hypothetical protein
MCSGYLDMYYEYLSIISRYIDFLFSYLDMCSEYLKQKVQFKYLGI